jgi:ribosomal protein S18 acetylase RimI-like enzyme
MNTNEQLDFRILEWDTGFFGFGVARVLAKRFTSARSLNCLVRELSLKEVKLAYFMTAPGDEVSGKLLRDSGAVALGTRVVYRADLMTVSLSPQHGSHDTSVEVFTESSPGEEYLVALAIQSARYSRFRLDGRIPKAKFEELYSLWATKSVNGKFADRVLVVRSGDRVLGMITLSVKDGAGHIGIISVDEKHREKGLGSILMWGAIEWFRQSGCTEVFVATQGENLAACAFYESSGFSVFSRDVEYHLWLD